ncbi:unnamed protein product [Zymoseptoria tritici ST99CH_1E4]|uniref:Uncharacterized protein n=1 Tax=Zymoseptoria tritici ST99CH_1E4 TaxID=1276532 RepID=A0A2H1FZM8_ZYMTR|nr:unnamed protein product [Zymoseptoria tritici ST99CH_1E4]
MPSRYALPFDAKLLEQVLDRKPEVSPNDDMTMSDTLAWLRSESILRWLKFFKVHIFDDRDMRWWLEGGASTELQQCADTIDSLVCLCLNPTCAQPEDNIPKDDGFETTAWIALHLVLEDSKCADSPFHGLPELGELRWSVNVTVRLLITVFCDLLDKPNGYFAKLLGGPKPKAFKDNKYCKKVMTVKNEPVADEKGMYGAHAKYLMTRRRGSDDVDLDDGLEDGLEDGDDDVGHGEGSLTSRDDGMDLSKEHVESNDDMEVALDMDIDEDDAQDTQDVQGTARFEHRGWPGGGQIGGHHRKTVDRHDAVRRTLQPRGETAVGSASTAPHERAERAIGQLWRYGSLR